MLAAEPGTFSAFGDDEIARLFEPLKNHKAIAVGVSGGPDSMALMLLLVRWRVILGQQAPDVWVLSVDHGLRREARDEVAEVGNMARKWGLKHQAFVWENAKDTSSNVQARAREARYGLMSAWCEHQQISHLLVAHTLNDQAETVLLRLARGSGVDGLSAMDRHNVWGKTVIYRPLLAVARKRLLQLLSEIDCSYVDDPSNHDPKYDRVQVRDALNVLAPLGITPQKLADTAGRLREARRALDVMTQDAFLCGVEMFDAGYSILDPQILVQSPPEIQRRLLGRLLRSIAGSSYPPEQASLESLLGWIGKTDLPARTLGGCLLMHRRNKVWVMRETGRGVLPELNLVPGGHALWDNRFNVSMGDSARQPMMVKALGVAAFAQLKAADKSRAQFPSVLGAGLPSFWLEQKLMAVPHLEFRSPECVCQIEAEFANSASLVMF